jgi:DNA replication protein DnaC
MLAKTIARLYREQRHGEIDWNRSNMGRIYRDRGGFINWGAAVNDRMLKGDYAFIEDVRGFEFFAIDDIISEYEKHRSLSAAKLYDILEGRLGKWTVITANASLSQIGESLDPRIASRMLRGGSTVLDVDVIDYNLRGKAA